MESGPTVRRRLANVVCVLCLLIAVATLALWLGNTDRLASRELSVSVPTRTPTTFLVALFDGDVWCGKFTTHLGEGRWNVSFQTDYGPSAGFYCMVMVNDFGREWAHLGRFGFASYSRRPTHEAFAAGGIIEFPAWLLILFFLLPPAIRLSMFVRKRHRALMNRCVRCGYDLRASPGRCPECGAVPQADRGLI